MVKPAVKYLLLLCAVIFVNLNAFSAHSLVKTHRIKSSSKIYTIKNPDSVLLQNQQANLGHYLFINGEQEQDEISILLFENEEDDEVTSHKKQICSDNLFTTLLFNYTTPDIAANPIQSVFHVGSISTEAPLYLVLQVFRI